MDPELLRYFDLVCDRIAAHVRYSAELERAANANEQLILNYHTHGPGQEYCVSVCLRKEPFTPIESPAPTEELAHIRGIGKNAGECGPRMAAFAARLTERYGLKRTPVVYLDGHPFTDR